MNDRTVDDQSESCQGKKTSLRNVKGGLAAIM